MSLLFQVLFYSFWMAILSFLAGLPAFWILSKSHSSLSLLVTQFTAGLLLSTCVTIVLPESIAHISLDKMQSSSFGPKILLGFISLYFIDAFSAKITKLLDHSYIDLNLDHDDPNINEERTIELVSVKDYFFSVISNSTTLGLLLHCFTDGVILTTSLLSQKGDEHSNLILIILSLFLHKLPASFSLTSILLNQGLHFKTVLFHLFLFSIFAPIGALVTYLFSHVLDYSDPNTGNSFVLLFSAGAFLYVSFHSFIAYHKHDEEQLSKDSRNYWDFLITIVGMLVPVLLSILHDD